jgi:hypothetical protein
MNRKTKQRLCRSGISWLLANYRRRRVAETFIGHGRRRVRVSTVRLSWVDAPGGEELLHAGCKPYETKIFGGPDDDFECQYATRDEAVAGHKFAVALTEVSIEAEQEKRARRRRMHRSYRARWA